MKHARCCATAVAWTGTLLAAPVWAASLSVPTPPAQANYMLNCMGCHLVDGSGAKDKVPSLRESLTVLSVSSAGRRYLVQVPGSAQSPLSDLELAQVLNWMVRNLSAHPLPAGFRDFSAQEVATYRRSTLVNVRATRAQLLSDGSARVAR